MNRRLVAVSSVLLLTLGLTACLWGAAIVSGTLSGLPTSASVTLQNNGTDNLTLRANGRFEFAGTLDEGETYAVTVLTDPVGATCSVANGSGTITESVGDVTNVAVTCVSNASITGTVSGLPSSNNVTLANGTETLVVTSNGAFAFPGIRAAGTAYSVTVSTQPSGLSCTVTNGSGTVVTGTPTNIAVSCS